MAGGLIDEIFIALGVKVDSKELDKFQKQLDKVINKTRRTGKENKGGKGIDALDKGFHVINGILPKTDKNFNKIVGILGKTGAIAGGITASIFGIASAIIAVTGAIDAMTLSLAKNNQFYNTFQRRTGMSAYDISGLATSASFLDMNLSEAQAVSELQGLQSRLTKLSITGEGAMPFQLAGINPIGMNSDDLMKSLNIRMQGLTAPQQAYLADQLGVSSLLPMLQLTSDKYDELIEKNKKFSLTDEQLSQLMEYGTELKMIQKQWDIIGKTFTLKVAKPFINFSKAVANFSEQLMNIITSIFTIVKNLLTPLQPLIDGVRLIGAIIRDSWVQLEDLLAFLSGSMPSYLGQVTGYNSFNDMMKDQHPLLNKLLNLSGVNPYNNDNSNQNNTQTNYFNFYNPLDPKGAVNLGKELAYYFVNKGRA